MNPMKLSQDLWAFLQGAVPDAACVECVLVALWSNGFKICFGPQTTSDKKTKRKLLKLLKELVQNIEEDLEDCTE
jgi:hypothetical protein